MIKANYTIFRFYLEMMDSFEKFLSEKYPNSSSIEDTKHYQTVIIGKIVLMFHTIELLTKDTLDEVSARCVLRGILDSVTAYCFIYQRPGISDMLFRHYLYALDGWRVYKKSVIAISEENDYKKKEDYACDFVISQIEEKLRSHTYYCKDRTTVETLMQNANWKYESLQNPRSLKYSELYTVVGFNTSSIQYLQGYLSQFVHGLSLSNRSLTDTEQMKRLLYESILIADRFIQAIFQTFNNKGMLTNFLCSNKVLEILMSKEIIFDDLAAFTRALIRKDKTILL